MRKIIILCFVVSGAVSAFCGGRPIQIIRCVDRSLADDAFLKGGTVLKAAVGDTTDRLCYPAPLNITGDLPSEICVGDATTLHRIFIIGDKLGIDTLLAGDAITVSAVSNFNLTEDPNNLVGNTTGAFRTSFIATPGTDGKGVVEVEFTRDPFQASTITFASATIGGSSTYTIPACTTVTPVSSIPTMGQWGLMALGLILLIFGINAIRQTVPNPTMID